MRTSLRRRHPRVDGRATCRTSVSPSPAEDSAPKRLPSPPPGWLVGRHPQCFADPDHGRAGRRMEEVHDLSRVLEPGSLFVASHVPRNDLVPEQIRASAHFPPGSTRHRRNRPPPKVGARPPRSASRRGHGRRRGSGLLFHPGRRGPRGRRPWSGEETQWPHLASCRKKAWASRTEARTSNPALQSISTQGPELSPVCRSTPSCSATSQNRGSPFVSTSKPIQVLTGVTLPRLHQSIVACVSPVARRATRVGRKTAERACAKRQDLVAVVCAHRLDRRVGEHEG